VAAPARISAASTTPDTAPNRTARVEQARPAAPLMPELSKPADSTRLYPLRSSQQPQPAVGPSPAAGKYYPKTYHQAAETRSLPPANQGQARDAKPSPAKSRKTGS